MHATDPARVLDQLIGYRPSEPGIAVSVLHQGRLAAQRCVGIADPVTGAPIRPDTRFHIVSARKTFTAASILILADRGLVSLDDDVRRHLPELHVTGPLTIRHLLSMTSGLRDALEIERLRGVWDSAPSRVDELLQIAFRQTHVSAPAGAEYQYCNLNVMLLDEIIRRRSGMTADAFRRQAIDAPLGLTGTGARPHEAIEVPGLAEPFVKTAPGWVRPQQLLGIAGDPLVSSLDDMTRWVLTLRAGAVGSTRITAAMSEPARLRDGSAIHYGLGLALRRYRGFSVLCHSGSQPGYKTHIAWLPEPDIAVVVLANREDAEPARLAREVVAALVGDGFPRPDPIEEAAERLQRAGLPPHPEAAIEGSYADAGTGEWMRLAFMGGVLTAETLGDPLYLYHQGDGVFCDGEDYRATCRAALAFEFTADTTVCRADLSGRRSRMRRQPSPRYASGDLESFVGHYASEEIDSRHRISLGSDGLRIQYGRSADLTFAMAPVAPDTFLVRPTAPGIDYRHVFRFERDRAGGVAAAIVTMDRLAGVKLAKTG